MPAFTIAPSLTLVEGSTAKLTFIFRDEDGTVFDPSTAPTCNACPPTGANEIVALYKQAVGIYTGSHIPDLEGVWLYEATGQDTVNGDIVGQVAVRVAPRYGA